MSWGWWNSRRPTVAEYLVSAVEFCNERLERDLGATMFVHPTTSKAEAIAVDRAIADLRYGSVGVNEWAVWAGSLGYTTWGGFPGNTPEHIGSGVGVIGNWFLLDCPQKSVVSCILPSAHEAALHREPPNPGGSDARARALPDNRGPARLARRVRSGAARLRYGSKQSGLGGPCHAALPSRPLPLTVRPLGNTLRICRRKSRGDPAGCWADWGDAAMSTVLVVGGYGNAGAAITGLSLAHSDHHVRVGGRHLDRRAGPSIEELGRRGAARG